MNPWGKFRLFPRYWLLATGYFVVTFSAFILASSAARAAGVETFFEPIDAKYRVGDPVAALPLKGAGGAPFPLEKTLGRKIVVLAFWIDVCDECVAQLKDLQRQIKKKGWGKKVAVVAIARGADKEEIKRAVEVAKAHKISADLAFDPEIVAARALGVIVAPSYLLVDDRGTLRTPPVLKPRTPVRDMDFFDFIEHAVKGRDIPPLQFVPPPERKEHRAMLGRKAPDFTLKTMDGRAVALKNYRGKNLLVYFWHPNCSYCVRQISRIQAYYEKRGKSLNFEVVALAWLSTGKDRNDAGKVYSDNGVTFPFLLDESRNAGDKYAVSAIPAAFFVDGGGVIREVRTGQVGDYEQEFDPVFLSMESKKSSR